ncbi:MAG: carboxypeptidase regulatory-like domain-containing protein [Bryobacteraceae bacterium]|nr:carboxypeptidase regulatory-like domain-containing protein [Bryobacteraceae bacterium]
MTGLAYGQPAGQIEGYVRDPQGAPVPGAVLRVTQAATGAERRVVTGERGWYAAAGLAPGAYRLELTHPGFRPETLSSVALDAGRVVRVDFQLELAQQQDSVEVAAEPPAISTSPADWSRSVKETELRSLPLNGRDLFDLAAQLPGTHIASTATRAMLTGRGARLSVNGSRPNQNSYRLDGLQINDATGAAPTSALGLLLGLETIREVHLASSPFDAEFGRAAGAVLTAVSKSGSNEWHGSLFEYLRNNALDARNFFDPPGGAPPLRKNQFGGLLSGPLRHNRLFALASYEGLRQVSTQTRRSVTPNADARAGRLPGRTLTVSPDIVPYLALFPLPNGADYGDGTGEFIAAVKTRSHEDLFTVRLDSIVSPHLRYGGRFTFDSGETRGPEPLLVFDFQNTSRYQFLHQQADFVPSQNTVHSLRAGFSRVWERQDSPQPANIPASLSFIPGRPFGVINFTAGLTNLGGDRLTGRSLLPRRYVLNAFQFNHTVTHLRGSHTWKAGLAFDRTQFNQLADLYANGFYSFNSLTELLLATPSSGSVMLPGSDSARGWRQVFLSAFVQDEFRVRPSLGFSVGLRYETYTTPSEVNGKTAAFTGDFFSSQSPVTGAPLFRNPSRLNFAPRAALAWSPFASGRTVFRAGAGVFYDAISSRELVIAGARMPPFFQRTTITRPAFPRILDAVAGRAPENSLDLLDYHLEQPYVLQFQFQIQHQLASGVLAQLGYVGSRGVHLMGYIGDYNPNRPQLLPDQSLYFPENITRMNPAYGSVAARRSQFDSSYHALQAGLSRRWAQGVAFQVKYAWGKSLDNASTSIISDFANVSGVPTMFNYRWNRGPSDFDLRHVLAMSLSWAIPGAGPAAAAPFLRGWELYLTAQAQSGPPFNPTVGFDRARLSGARTADLNQRPDLVWPIPGRVILRDPQRWFDPLAFALPHAGRYGNLGRNSLQGPGLAVVDAALHKVLWRTERQSVRFRAETFNLTNHPNFQVPSVRALFDSSLNRVGSAGQITATTTSSRQIQLALRYEF